MLNYQKTGLLIFDHFSIDFSLIKYKVKAKRRQLINAGNRLPNRFESLDLDPNEADSFELSFDNDATPSISGASIGPDRDFIDADLDRQKEMWKRLLIRFFMFLFGRFILKKKPKITVQHFFSLVKADLKSPETYIEKVTEFLKIAEHAKSMGQIALYEETMRDINLVKQEALLLASDFKTCITEQQIIQFYKESDKGLRLHFIKNFTRVIPLEVLKIKTRADELMVFDNYVILYYDKDAKTFKQTQQEKDPIIFGVISGIRKLYYIADWVDEFCDLTLKELVDKFGQDAISANDITVKYNKQA